MTKKLLLIISMLLYLSTAIPTASAESIDDRVQEISYLLLCPVCQGQTVEESNSYLAKDMRSIIRKKLEAGESKEQILGYFVDKYGETILAAPPAKGMNWLLWSLPVIAFAAGGLIIGIFLYKSKGRKEEEIKQPPQTKVASQYMDEVDKELKNYES